MRARHGAIIVTHSTPVFGPPNALADYLMAAGVDVLYIDHPLDYDPKRESRLELWRDGRLILERRYRNWLAFRPVNYLKDFVVTLWILLRYGRDRSYRWYFGLDSLACLAALWLRPWLAYEKLIGYNADYSTNRFHSPVLNLIYQLVDGYTMKRVNAIWCVTERIAKIRRQKRPAETVVVLPNGVDLAVVTASGKHDQGLVFIGNLTAEKGLEPIIRACAKLPHAHLTIYGEGIFKPTLVELVSQLKVGERIIFAGQLANKEILKRLADYSVGIALYKDSESYVYYSDPLKVKEYLAAGLPVIVSNVPEIAEAIAQTGAGVVVADETGLPAAIERALDNRSAMSQAALQLAKRYDWRLLFDNAFKLSDLHLAAKDDSFQKKSVKE